MAESKFLLYHLDREGQGHCVANHIKLNQVEVDRFKLCSLLRGKTCILGWKIYFPAISFNPYPCQPVQELNPSAGNNFSLVTGHMSFQIFLLVGHLTNWIGHNLLTDNTLKKRTQDLLVRCSVIVSDHNVKLAGHFQNLVGQCPMTD